jgi:Flp pilus assembly protein TadG
MRSKKPGNLLVEEVGTEIAEAALVLPLMFMLLLGIYWFGRALNTYETINHAAMEAARIAAAHSCATCPNGNQPLQATNTPLAGNAVQQALQASGLDPTQAAEIPNETLTACSAGISQTSSCNDPGGPRMCVYYDVLLDDPLLNANFGPAQSCGVYVSFQYPYQFYFPFTSLNLQQLTLKARVQVSGEH